ncbi:MAG TPA: patatin-like phospholipase family protein [Xanthomonadaceae bacterium]|nr:patatin-like phospholipase family protein [Xanthomonadaceae bacterium]
MNPTDPELESLRTRRESVAARALTRSTRRPRDLALCLSGGGYRAALFHLGAMLRLHETGLLGAVDLVSSVSGGSIVSAWLATRYLRGRAGPQEGFADWCARTDFRAVVVDPFERITARDIRTSAVLRTAVINLVWPSRRVALLERAYERFLGGAALSDLPDAPRFVFCATNLTCGVNWEFSRERVGDFLTGYLREPRRIALAHAVAASSSFPPLFGPVRFAAGAGDFMRGRLDGEGDALRDRIELTDGGVYDNLATEPALRRYRTVLVSDAGAPFAFAPGRNWLRRLLRYTQVVGNQAVALRKRLLFTLTGQGTIRGAYWSLSGGRDPGADGYSAQLVAEVIARVRTDLDRFDPDEFRVLVNHGYFACQNGLQAGVEIASTAPPPRWPYPEHADESQVRRALRHSHRRLRPLRWRSGSPAPR